MMHKLGLCISHDRVMEISTEFVNSVTAQFEQDWVVYPPILRRDVFTTAGIDKHIRIKTRRAHQGTAACFFILQNKTYSDYGETLENDEEPL